jgi:hypothetical protein
MDFSARKPEAEEVRHMWFFFSLLRSICALIRRLICGPNTSFMAAVLLAILHCHRHCRCRAVFIVIKIMAWTLQIYNNFHIYYLVFKDLKY